MQIIRFFYVLILFNYCTTKSPEIVYERTDRTYIKLIYKEYTEHKIQLDSLLNIYSNYLNKRMLDNKDIILIQENIDHLDSSTQMKFYIDHINLDLQLESNEMPKSQTVISEYVNDKGYFILILENRKYNFEQVSQYIARDLSRCDRNHRFFYYRRLIKTTYFGNYNLILEYAGKMKDTCTTRNLELFKSIIN